MDRPPKAGHYDRRLRKPDSTISDYRSRTLRSQTTEAGHYDRRLPKPDTAIAVRLKPDTTITDDLLRHRLRLHLLVVPLQAALEGHSAHRVIPAEIGKLQRVEHLLQRHTFSCKLRHPLIHHHQLLPVRTDVLPGEQLPMARNDDVEVELEDLVEHGHPLHSAGAGVVIHDRHPLGDEIAGVNHL